MSSVNIAHWSLLYTSDTWAALAVVTYIVLLIFFTFYACTLSGAQYIFFLLQSLISSEIMFTVTLAPSIRDTVYLYISLTVGLMYRLRVYMCIFFDERWRWPAWKDDQYIQPVNFTLSMQSISWFHVEDPVYSTLHKKSTSIFNLSTLCCPCSLFYGLLNISGCVHCQAAVRPI